MPWSANRSVAVLGRRWRGYHRGRRRSQELFGGVLCGRGSGGHVLGALVAAVTTRPLTPGTHLVRGAPCYGARAEVVGGLRSSAAGFHVGPGHPPRKRRGERVAGGGPSEGTAARRAMMASSCCAGRPRARTSAPGHGGSRESSKPSTHLQRKDNAVLYTGGFHSPPATYWRRKSGGRSFSRPDGSKRVRAL